MSSSTRASILFIMSSILLLSSKSISSSRISYTCENTELRDFDAKWCIEILESNEQTAKAKDYYDLTTAILKVGTKNMTRTRTYMIKKLDQESKSNSSLKGVLQQCIGSYEGVIGNFGSALEELKEEVDTISASYDVLVASNDAIQPCMAAVRSANVTDENIVNGNKYVWVYMISAGTAVDRICTERTCCC